MYNSTGTKSRKHFCQLEVHVTTSLHDMRGVDKQKIIDVKLFNHFGINALDSLRNDFMSRIDRGGGLEQKLGVRVDECAARRQCEMIYGVQCQRGCEAASNLDNSIGP